MEYKKLKGHSDVDDDDDMVTNVQACYEQSQTSVSTPWRLDRSCDASEGLGDDQS
jgi:hypothetical protein